MTGAGERLSHLIESRGWILADGATGTNLFNMGLKSGDAPEFWNERHPDRIRALYQGSVNVGADVFLTNSFGGNAARLALHGAADRARELSRLSAELAREVADSAGRPVAVAGSIGPTGELIQPLGSLAPDRAVEILAEQAAGLAEGGVDMFWIETMSAIEELTAASEAVRGFGLPWCATMSFDTAGRTMMGVTEADLARAVTGIAPAPFAIGANCGLGAPDLLRTVLGFADSGLSVPIIAKANAGIPRFRHGKIRYDASVETMADYAVLARDCGATLIGGCCGTTATHLDAMRIALEQTSPGQRPSLDEISRRLGGFVGRLPGPETAGRETRRKGLARRRTRRTEPQ
ncbi:MAG: betaine--homocysteine S-methyltransferase [Paracoccaceae bacterium]|nr:betaine--homocysteine S-methyltransferase [Paracoccaceae bacterium]